MAKEYIIEAEPRTIIGKQVKQLRRQGLTPAVIYGKNEAVAIQVNSLKTYLTLRDADANAILTVNVNGKSHIVLAREVQRHVTRGELLHVDFLEVSKDTMITAEVVIVTEGKSLPEVEGLGITTQLLSSIEIEAPADRLISELVVDLSQIKSADDTIMVGDLVVPEGVTIITAPDISVATFQFHRKEEEVEDLDAPIIDAGEVELISETDEEESFE